MNPNGQEGPEGDEPDYHPEEFEGQSAGEMELFIVPPNLPRTRQKRPSSRGKAPAADESGPAAQRRRTSEASEPAASEQPQSQCPQQSSSTSSRLKSKVWMDFTKISQDGAKVTVAECKHCKAILSADSKNGTSHLLRHTNQQHKTDQSTVNNFFLKSETNDDGTPVLRNVKYDVHAARQAISIYIVAGSHPFTTVQEHGFKTMLATVCPQFKAIGRHTIKIEIMAHNVY